jgi:hypothetical protein
VKGRASRDLCTRACKRFIMYIHTTSYTHPLRSPIKRDRKGTSIEQQQWEEQKKLDSLKKMINKVIACVRRREIERDFQWRAKKKKSGQTSLFLCLSRLRLHITRLRQRLLQLNELIEFLPPNGRAVCPFAPGELRHGVAKKKCVWIKCPSPSLVHNFLLLFRLFNLCQ